MTREQIVASIARTIQTLDEAQRRGDVPAMRRMRRRVSDLGRRLGRVTRQATPEELDEAIDEALRHGLDEDTEATEDL